METTWLEGQIAAEEFISDKVKSGYSAEEAYDLMESQAE